LPLAHLVKNQARQDPSLIAGLLEQISPALGLSPYSLSQPGANRTSVISAKGRTRCSLGLRGVGIEDLDVPLSQQAELRHGMPVVDLGTVDAKKAVLVGVRGNRAAALRQIALQGPEVSFGGRKLAPLSLDLRTRLCWWRNQTRSERCG
jgi:hypothetical protein